MHPGNWSNLKHGDVRGYTKTQEYTAWYCMKQRCLNPKNKDYARYGGRGITVCAQWLEYANFIADMGRKPGPTYMLDRINNDGSYEPSNCRWASFEVSMLNRNDGRIWINGKSLRDISAETGIPFGTLYDRYRRGVPLA